MLGFSLGGILLSGMWTLRGLFQLYGEKALGITTSTVLIIVLIYIIWDAVNDPVTGYLLDRSTKFTSKGGKRFPFIIIGALGAVAFLILIYIPVSSDPLIAAIWILIILIVWDQFQTIMELSSSGLTVDIFRDKKQRVKLGVYGILIGAIGSLVFGIVPATVLGLFGGESSAIAYLYMIIILGGFLLLVLIPYGYSIREPLEMIQLRARLDSEGKSSSPFKEVMKRVLTDKDWMSLVFAYLGYVVAIQCITVGTYFYVVDGMGLSVGMVAFFNLVFLGVQFASAPLWNKIANKKGAKKTYTYSLFLFVIMGILFPIIGWTLLPALILSGLGGLANAGQGIAFTAVSSETIDNASVKSGKREETSFSGVLRFFSASGIFWQVLIFMLVEIATGYDPTIIYDYNTGIIPSQMARIGLNLRISIIPAIIVLVTAIIYMKFNKITAEVALENKKKLIEMNL